MAQAPMGFFSKYPNSLSTTFACLLLRMIRKDLDGLVHLGRKGVLVFQKMQQFTVVHFKEHAGDLAGLVLVRRLDEREKALAKHLFLLRVGRGRQGGCRQRLL